MKPEVVPARCQFPIVLLHGLFGFTQRRLGPLRFTYFRSVAPYLESVGNRVVAIAVPARGRIEERALKIVDALESHPLLRNSPVNLIAHSMGGLDGRYLISRLGYADRVRSLTTLATPHRGSYLANALSIPGLRIITGRLVPALQDLHEKALARFSDETPDDSNVRYFSVPAKADFFTCSPFLWPTFLFLLALRGANDGQVPFESAKWGEVLEEAKADHIHLIGLRLGLNAFFGESHLNLYGRITRILEECGF